MQSKLAIGSGQVFGMGLLMGNQTQLRLFISKDYRLYFLSYRWGNGLYNSKCGYNHICFYDYKSNICCKNSKGWYSDGYIAIGIAGILTFHMVENIGMTMGLLPITGVPLPFVSYGGSSLITNFICIGLLLNISSRRKKAIFID